MRIAIKLRTIVILPPAALRFHANTYRYFLPHLFYPFHHPRPTLNQTNEKRRHQLPLHQLRCKRRLLFFFYYYYDHHCNAKLTSLSALFQKLLPSSASTSTAHPSSPRTPKRLCNNFHPLLLPFQTLRLKHKLNFIKLRDFLVTRAIPPLSFLVAVTTVRSPPHRANLTARRYRRY